AGAYKLTPEREVGFEIAAYDATRPLVIDPPVMAYSTFLGGTGEDTGIEIAVNAHGDAFVTGFTTSADFPGAGSAPRGPSDAFVIRFNASGLPIYSTYLGGSSLENFYGDLQKTGIFYGGIAIDSSDNAYVTGLTTSPNFPHSGAGLKGLSDAFVTKLNAAGNM